MSSTAQRALRISHQDDDWSARVDTLRSVLAETAIQRDARGGTPYEERALVRASGLLALTIPHEFGGLGQSFGCALDVVRLLAQVDPALAHVFGFHHLMLFTLQLFGSEGQWRPLLAEVARERTFWGNALNPKDTRTRLTAEGEDYRLEGTKSFCSGARDSDRLIVSALEGDPGRLVVFTLRTRSAGIDTRDDWDAFGQRQTDSGTVDFRGVRVTEEELLRSPGPLATPRAALRPCLAQAILVHVYLGIAEGAFAEAQARHRAGSARSEDVFVQHRAGELSLELETASLFAERARAAIDRELARAELVTEHDRGLVALDVARAKVTSTRAALHVGQGIFELLGPRATARTEALDRYWRNARVHTLHDPVDEKVRELGSFALSARLPTPGFYA